MSTVKTFTELLAQLPASGSADGKSVVLADGSKILSGLLPALFLIAKELKPHADLNDCIDEGLNIYATAATGTVSSLKNNPSTTNHGEFILLSAIFSGYGFHMACKTNSNNLAFELWLRAVSQSGFGAWHRFAFLS